MRRANSSCWAGRRKSHPEGGRRHARHIALVSREDILFVGQGGLTRCSVVDKESSVWMQTKWLGNLMCPPVMANLRVYFATSGRGPVAAKGKGK